MSHVRQEPRGRKVGKTILILVLVILLLAVGVVGFFLLKGYLSPSSAFSSTVPVLADADGSLSDPDADTLKTFKKGYHYNEDIVNILLLGIDSDASRVERHMGWRSDVMIIAAINTKTKDIQLVSIPRDTYTQVNKLDSDGKIKSTEKNKINAAFAFGGGPKAHSYPNAVAAVRHLMSGIPIHGYAGTDMDQFAKLVDGLGGVTLEITDDMTKRDPDFPAKGTTATLNGTQALTYVRERYTTAGGDTGRSRRQRELLSAILATGQKKGMVVFATQAMATVGGDVTTSLNFDQIMTLAAIAGGTDLSKMEMVSLDGKFGRSEDDASIFIPDKDKLEELILNTWMVKN
jgi:LCP family protein required for cell wall assembly